MAESKRELGTALIRRLFKGSPPAVPLPAEFGRMTVEHLFGDLWQGKDLALEERSLITCTVLVALGREPEQRIHFRGARNLGIPRARLEAMIAHVAHYAGWPVAASALRTLDEVWKAMDAESESEQARA